MAEVQKTIPMERIRGSNLAVLAKRSSGVPFEEALRGADEGKFIIASNSRLSKALVDSNEWKTMKELFACWSGTMTAYVGPNVKLPEKVEYVDPNTGYRWVFSVPEQFRGKTNAILVAEHPDYTLEIDGKNRVIHATSIDLVENFPAKDGWYKGDPKHDIPIVSQSGSERYLWRINERVGPAARGYNNFGVDIRQSVGLVDQPSGSLGVAVESLESRVLGIIGAAPVATQTPLTTDSRLIRISPTELKVDGTFTGTPEQLDAAVRLLGPLGQK